jgi:hypothetical protein
MLKLYQQVKAEESSRAARDEVKTQTESPNSTEIHLQ